MAVVARITDSINAINAIWLTVPGVKRVFTEAPDVAPSGNADLPCVIPIVTDATMTAQAFGYLRKDYTIKYYLLVSTRAQKLESIEKLARPFIDDTFAAFFPHVQLNDSAHIDHFGNSNVTLTMKYVPINYDSDISNYIGYEVLFEVTGKKEVVMQNS